MTPIGTCMHTVRTLTAIIHCPANRVMRLLSAASVGICGAAFAQDTAPSTGAGLPIVEWSVRPPMSAEYPRAEPTRELRLSSPGAPVLIDPVAPTERLRQAQAPDVLRVPIAAPHELPADRSRLMVSLRATPTSRTRMFVEQATLARTASPWLVAQAADAPTTRVGLELRSASAESRLGVSNVLKMQLSGGSTLLLKPRRSGIAVTWRSEF